MDKPQCSCFQKSSPNKGEVITDEIGASISTVMFDLLAAHQVCSKALDHVVVHTVVGVLLIAAMQKKAARGRQILEANTTDMEDDVLDLIKFLPDVVRERLTLIEKAAK